MERIQAESAKISVQGLVLPNGLRVDSVEVLSSGISAVKEPFSLSLAEPASLAAKLSEKSIANFLEETAPGNIRLFEVAAQDGQLFVRASVRMLIEVRGLIICRLEVVDGRQIHVRLVDAQFMGVNPRQLVENQLNQFNPLLDIAEFPVEGWISGVDVADGFVTVNALVAGPA